MGKHLFVHSLDWEETKSFNKVYSKILLNSSECKAFGLSIQRVCCGAQVPKHSHKEESLYFFLSGTGKVYLGENTIQIQSGLVVYISSYETHGVENTGEENIKYIEIKSPNTI